VETATKDFGKQALGGLLRKVDPQRMECIWSEGVVLEGDRGIAGYWSRRDTRPGCCSCLPEGI
jgi:hypothetical protein